MRRSTLRNLTTAAAFGLALVCAARPASAGIDATTSVYLFRGEPGNFNGSGLLDINQATSAYAATKTDVRAPLYNQPYAVMHTYVQVDNYAWQAIQLTRFLAGVYGCVAGAVTENPDFVRNCWGLPSGFGNIVAEWQGLDALDERTITLQYPHDYYDMALVDFVATSDSDALEQPQVAHPSTAPAARWWATRKEPHVQAVQVLIDLVRLREQIGPDRFYDPMGIPIGLAVREDRDAAPITRLTTGHHLRLRILRGAPEFEARVTTSATYQRAGGAQLVSGGLVPNIDPAQGSLDFRYPGGPSTDIRAGVLHLQYAPDGQFYVDGKAFDSVRLDFLAHSDTPLYQRDPHMRVSFNGAVPTNGPYPLRNPSITAVAPITGSVGPLTFRHEGEGRISTTISPRQHLGAHPGEYTVVNVAEYYGYGTRFLAQQSVRIITEPIQRPATPLRVVPLPGDGQASLTWNPVPGATSYNVFFRVATPLVINTNGTSNGTKIPVGGNGYTRLNLTNGVTYYFAVSAVNPAGESLATAPVAIVPHGRNDGLQTLVLDATADAYVHHGEPGTTHESSTSLTCSNTNGREQRAFLQFDLARLPTNAQIERAELDLIAWSNQGHGTPYVEVYAIAPSSAPFSEATLTWNNQPGVGSSLVVSSPLAAPRANRIALDPARLQGFVGAGASIWRGVRVGLSTSNSNVYNDVVTFWPSEATTAANRPKLKITYLLGAIRPNTGGGANGIQ